MNRTIRAILPIAVIMLMAACASSSSRQPDVPEPPRMNVPESSRVTVSEMARIGAAKAEMATVKMGLGMFQAESDISAYPGTARITSYQTLRDILSPYLRMPEAEDASWTFASYARAREDTFVLKGRARDSARTVITVTPTGIWP
ncbi:hypothetical protein ACFL6R_05615 [Gemmatimonadota bacterium]